MVIRRFRSDGFTDDHVDGALLREVDLAPGLRYIFPQTIVQDQCGLSKLDAILERVLDRGAKL